MKKNTFANNPFMKVMNWLYLVFAISLLFSLTNLPFTLCALFLAIDLRNWLFFALALIPFGGSVIAGLAVADQFFAKQVMHPVKDYAQALIRFFTRGTVLWLPVWLALLVLGADLWFILPRGGATRVLGPLFIVLILVGLGLVVNAWYLQVRNPEHGPKAVWASALYYLGKRWFIALANALLLLLLPVLMVIKPQFGMVVTPGLLLALIYVNCEFLGKRALWKSRNQDAQD